MNARARVIAAVLAVGTLAGCSAGTSPSGTGTGASSATGTSSAGATGTSDASSSRTTSSASTTTDPSSPTSTTAKPTPPKPATPKPSSTPETPPPLTDDSLMKVGSSGPAVERMQQKLSDLGYWLGTPDGEYGYQTSQAVMALQKTAGLGRDGVYGPATRAALAKGVRPKLSVSGNAVQINLATQVLTIVENGAIVAILNTSTGSGQQYVNEGETRTAITPRGTFAVILQIDGLDRGPLGDLWRPKYFVGGIAVHGSASVPGYPASHGCARVSNAAMDMIWARNLMPMGRTVVVV